MGLTSMSNHKIEVKYHGLYEQWCVVINGEYELGLMFDTEQDAQTYADSLVEA